MEVRDVRPTSCRPLLAITHLSLTAHLSDCRVWCLQSFAAESSLHCTVLQFFTEYGEANRYLIKEVIGKGSYGVVCSATDSKTGEKVAIKKINNVFDHVSDATRILREIKLLRLLRHPGEQASCIPSAPSRQ